MNTTDDNPENVRGDNRHILRGKGTDRATLAAIARQAMIERGLEPDFPPAAQHQLAAIGRAGAATDDVRDMRDRLWASIDNDDSRDLDQLTLAEPLFFIWTAITLSIGFTAQIRADGLSSQHKI